MLKYNIKHPKKRYRVHQRVMGGTWHYCFKYNGIRYTEYNFKTEGECYAKCKDKMIELGDHASVAKFEHLNGRT